MKSLRKWCQIGICSFFREIEWIMAFKWMNQQIQSHYRNNSWNKTCFDKWIRIMYFINEIVDLIHRNCAFYQMKSCFYVYHQFQIHFSLALGWKVPRNNLLWVANSPPKWPSFGCQFAAEMAFVWVPIYHQNGHCLVANLLTKWVSFWMPILRRNRFYLDVTS